jgi:hypothetical protein
MRPGASRSLSAPPPLTLHMTLSLKLLAATCLVAFLAALPSAAVSSPVDSPSASAAAAKCVAQIRKGNKLVPVYQKTYVYKYVHIKGFKTKFKRVVKRVRRKVKVSCAKQCVVMKKKKKKRRPVYVTKRVKVKIKRGNRILTVKRRKRVYKYGRCPASSANGLGVPVKISILDGSYALLDFGAFQRQAPVSGTFKGFIPGKIQLNSDTQVNLTGGSLSIGQTPVFIDDTCNGEVSASIRTGAPTTVGLDPTRQSVATLFASGTVTSTAYTTIHLPLDLRNDDTGCNSPYVTTGYSEFSQTFFLKGKVGDGGLTALTLTSAPDTLNVVACLSPGQPTQPCNGFQIPLPILVSTKLRAAIDLSGKG